MMATDETQDDSLQFSKAEDAPVPSTPSSEPEEEGHEEGQPRQSRQQPPRQEVEDGGEDRVMPVADVMALLQAMREEQLDSLKAIADGVQQLQSQVMVLGETAISSEEKTTLCLDRLAGVEVRIASIPVPMKSPGGKNPYQNVNPAAMHGGARGVGSRPAARVGGGGNAVRGDGARIPAFAAAQASPAVQEKAPPPPPPAAAGPGRVPTWLDRGKEPEPARPHFMRNAPQSRSSPTASPSPAPQATQSPPSSAPAQPAVTSAEDAAKQAKRQAFAADRARMQARIAAKKGGVSAATASPVTAASAATKPSGTTPRQPQGHEAKPPNSFTNSSQSAVTTQPGGTESQIGVGGRGGAFSGSPSFLDGGGNGGERRGEEDESVWLERQTEGRERKERARKEAVEAEKKRKQEEAERLERERIEARRRQEEEDARLAREAEEAAARAKARREAEQKRQAKTRVLMSSLFDKDDADDGNSLFGGLGAALPAGSSVFDDGQSASDNKSPAATTSSPSAKREYLPEGEASTRETSSSNDNSGLSGSLFAGMDDVGRGSGSVGVGGAGGGGGMFDGIDSPTSSGLGGFPSSSRAASGGGVVDKNNVHGADRDEDTRGSLFGNTMKDDLPGFSSGRDARSKLNDDDLEGSGGLFDTAPTVDLDTASSPTKDTALHDSDAFDRIFGNDGDNSSPATAAATTGAVAGGNEDEQDDDLLTMPSSSAVAGGSNPEGSDTGGKIGAERPTRGSIFEDDDMGGDEDNGDDDIFSRPNAEKAGSSSKASGGMGGVFTGGGRSTSLFERDAGEFSIDSGDDDGMNVFGNSSSSAGKLDHNTSFLSALGDVDLSPSAGEADESAGGDKRDPDEEGMVEVSL